MTRSTNERTGHKPELPLQYLKPYITRKLVRKANDKGYKKFLGETIVIDARTNYIDAKGVTSTVSRKPRLAQTLYLEINMPVMLFQNAIYG